MRAAAQLTILLIGAALVCSAPVQAQELEISGRVVDEAGVAASGVKLRLVPTPTPYEQASLELTGASLPEPVARATTDSAGDYRLVAPEAGFWRVLADREGSVTMEYPWRREPLLEAATLPDLQLIPGRAIRVTVERPSGKPAARAWVESWITEAATYPGWNSGWRAYTPPVLASESGVATVIVPAQAEIELQAWSVGHRASEKVAAASSAAQLRLRRATARTLRITDSIGSVLEGAILRADRVEWPVGHSDENGLLILHGERDESEARVLLADGRSAWLRLTGDEGLAGEPFEYRFAQGRTLSGRVLDSESRSPVNRAFVYPSGAVARNVRSDSRGGFTLTVDAHREAGLSAAAAGYLPAATRLLPESGEITLAVEPATHLPGRVLDTSGEPIAGASILAQVHHDSIRQFRSPFRTPGRIAVSDSTGSFHLPRLSRKAAYAVTASREGFATGEEIVRDIQETAGAGGVTLVLSQGTVLSGRVLAPDGHGVSGATISLERLVADQGLVYYRGASGQPQPFNFEFTTDPEGEFSFADTPAGEFTLEVSASGFARQALPVFEIDAGAPTHDLGLLTLEAGVDLSGRVIDTDGLPLVGAQIAVSTQGGAVFSSSSGSWGTDVKTLSGPDGSFTIVDRRRGEFLDLEVELSGYSSESLPRVEVPAEPGFEVILQPGVTLTGRVTDPQGQPITGASVAVAREGGGSSFSGRVYSQPDAWGRSDELGRFTVMDVAPGTVRVSAQARGWLPTELGDVELVAGQEPEPLEIELRLGATVSGVVLGPDGSPISEAIVGVRSATGGRSATTSDGEGNYTLGGVEPGIRVIAAHHENSESIQELEVEVGDNRLDFYFEAGVDISGSVVSPDGNPVEGAQLSLASNGVRSNRSGPSARSDGAGRFVIGDVKAGTFELTAQHPDFGSTVLSEPIEVGAAPLTGLQIRLSPSVLLRGSILGAEAADLVNLEVVAIRQQGRVLQQGRVDSDGGYQIKGLSAGSWQLSARSGTGRQVAEHVDIAEGESEVLLDLEFEEGVTLSGTVSKGADKVAGAWVVVSGNDIGAGASAQTDHQGRFKLQGLKTGAYTLRVSEFESGLSHSQELEILRDDDIVVELGGAAISGLVTDRDGRAPLVGASLVLESMAETSGPMRGPSKGATSDAAGRYHLANVSPGRYRLRASKAGYAAQSQELDLTAPDVEEVDFDLEEVEGLSFTALLPSQTPASRVTYALRDPAGSVVQGGREAATSDGRLRLASVPDGEWNLLLLAPGAAVQTIRTPAPRDDLMVRFERAASVTVRVEELVRDDSSVARLRVTGADGLRHELPDWNGAVTDEWRLRSGRHTLEHLSAGRWIISISAVDGRSWERSIHLDPGANDDIIFD